MDEAFSEFCNKHTCEGCPLYKKTGECEEIWQEIIADYIKNNKGLALCDNCDYYVSVEETYKNGEEDGRRNAIEEFRRYLKTVTPCEMPQELWDMGVDNTCDRMLKGE